MWKMVFVWVQTITMSHEDFELNARFYHSVAPSGNGRRTRLTLLGKRVALTLRRNYRPTDVIGRRLVRCRKQQRVVYSRRFRRRTFLGQTRGNVTPTSSNAHLAPIVPKDECNSPLVPQLASLTLPDAGGSMSPDQQNISTQEMPRTNQPLGTDASSQHVAHWLQGQRFSAYIIRTFTSFSGEDILRLSRDDLTQICGLADGIRLYNALHLKTIAPQLTIYLCIEQTPPPEHHALFLHTLSAAELTEKLAQLLGVSCEQIIKIYIQGPSGMHVIVTDEVVRNVKEDSMFSIEVLTDQSGERYRLLLKPMCP